MCKFQIGGLDDPYTLPLLRIYDHSSVQKVKIQFDSIERIVGWGQNRVSGHGISKLFRLLLNRGLFLRKRQEISMIHYFTNADQGEVQSNR